MKRSAFILLFFCGSITLLGQFNKAVFIDSLKNTPYLKEYFSTNNTYSDSSFAEYMVTKANIDTFEIDSNGGFGFKPTGITITYKNAEFLKFYTGLEVTKGKNNRISELSFYNYGSQKTAHNWLFHSNGNIYKTITYKSKPLDSISNFGSLITESTTYSFKQFKKSGSIQLTGSYENGEKTGNWFYFDKNGILYKKEKYKANKRISKVSF